MKLAKKVRDVIVAINSVGVLHRDITWENVLVDKQENIWVVDFDRAQVVCDMTKQAMLEHDMGIYFDTLNDLLGANNLGRVIPP